ncbi:MAG: manganese efflux pump MntP family protein [Bacillota bacterium]|nr:manganese efflux pump MntP family protein [Bacillota bacterium]
MMNISDIFLIGLGLSMDAVAVSMTNSMVYQENRKRLRMMPVFFGAFQAIMPILGFFAGSLFAELIKKYSGIITLVILAFIGGNMIREAISGADSKEDRCVLLTYKALTAQAVATSIDAFAIGVSFSLMGGGLKINIFWAALLIGCTTAVCSILAILLGKKFGNMLGGKAEIFGGAILIIIGIKAVLGF